MPLVPFGMSRGADASRNIRSKSIAGRGHRYRFEGKNAAILQPTLICSSVPLDSAYCCPRCGRVGTCRCGPCGPRSPCRCDPCDPCCPCCCSTYTPTGDRPRQSKDGVPPPCACGRCGNSRCRIYGPSGPYASGSSSKLRNPCPWGPRGPCGCGPCRCDLCYGPSGPLCPCRNMSPYPYQCPSTSNRK
ncbi:hypothetical protein EVAR_15933_1 [Eumeta japonica]|uniref:Uncharacterized protein n=1 Tax=Eumeta variegata TaxID=151549 RepID=A0A4C1ULW4_EUMVA|nr:hypothetical protein EVAR_15933_1 [Eumeta japonica]